MNIDLEKTFAYINSHNSEFFDDLKKLIKIPTVGAFKKNKKDLFEGVKFLKNLFKKAEIDNIKIFDEYEKPFIFAEKILNPDYKTILLYAHYDVQPAEPLNLWNTEPFDLTIKDDKMFARGISDDKGSVIMLIKAVEALIKTKKLNCNVKFLFEGGEETGSEDLINFLKEKNTEFLKNDLTLMCDSTILNKKNPVTIASARGVFCFELKILGANRDLHSGAFGGIVGNPIHALSHIINSFHDENNHILIENFYRGVNQISIEEHEICKKINFNEEEQKKDLGISDFVKKKQFLPLEIVGLQPTIEVNGIEGGYNGEGVKTIIPSFAKAKISCRLVGKQNTEFIFDCVYEHVKKNLPKGFTFEMNMSERGGSPFRVDIHSDYFKSYCSAFEKEFGKYPLPSFGGGSIGIGSFFQDLLHSNILLCGFYEEDSFIHSPNENLAIENFTKGLKTLVRFLNSCK